MDLITTGAVDSTTWVPDENLMHSDGKTYDTKIGDVISDISSVCFEKKFARSVRLSIYVNFYENGNKRSRHYYSGRIKNEDVCFGLNCKCIKKRYGCENISNGFQVCAYRIMQNALKFVIEHYVNSRSIHP